MTDQPYGTDPTHHRSSGQLSPPKPTAAVPLRLPSAILAVVSHRCYLGQASLSSPQSVAAPNSKHWFTTSFLHWTTAVFSYAIGPWKLSANEQFCVGAQTVVRLLQTTQIISDVYFITDHVVYASWNKPKIVWIEEDPFYFTRGGCVSCLRAC